MGVQVTPEQEKPLSVAQEEEQPSELVVLLSSQVSLPSRVPLPHTAAAMVVKEKLQALLGAKLALTSTVYVPVDSGKPEVGPKEPDVVRDSLMLKVANWPDGAGLPTANVHDTAVSC
jgi:hypothetical protein